MKWIVRILLAVVALAAVALSALAFTISRTEQCGPPPAAEVAGESMRAVRYRCYGAPEEVLELAQLERPQPGPEELLVRVHRAAVNPLDWHYMRGSPYFMRLQSGLGRPDDTRLGVDFAGTVVAVGDAVTRFRPGDAVFGGAAGAFAEYLLVRQDRAVAPLPEGVSFDQAAGVAIAGVTALQALQDRGRLQPGERVLINGASGGVGTFAVQIARAMGAEVYGVCSGRNAERVLKLGATRVFDYKKEDYTESGLTFDLILDLVGNHSMLANRRVMAPTGRMVVVGGPKGDWVGPMSGPLSAMAVSPFVEQEFLPFLATLSGDALEELGRMMAAGQVTPAIDRHFPLDDIAEAISYSETGRARGKILIDVSPLPDDRD